MTGGHWAARQAVNRDRALLHGWRMLDEAGTPDNLRIAAGKATGRYRGSLPRQLLLARNSFERV